jgi:hypothetical protein
MSSISPRFNVYDAQSLVSECLRLEYFWPNNDGIAPINAHWRPGQGNLVLVLGDNASGKSFFRRIVGAVCREIKVEHIHLSMEGRNGDFGGLRCMVYGDEGEESTGVNSIHTVTTGIKTCRGRETKHVIFWDEPDLGLSDNSAAGVGIAIRDFATSMPQHTVAAIIVTHSRALVQQLVPVTPHFLYLGEENVPPTIEDWLAAPIVPIAVDELKERSRRRWRLISTILNDIQRSKKNK